MPIRPSRTRRTTIDGIEATVFYMPKRAQAFYAGHVALEWQTQGTTFQARGSGSTGGPGLTSAMFNWPLTPLVTVQGPPLPLLTRIRFL